MPLPSVRALGVADSGFVAQAGCYRIPLREGSLEGACANAAA
ncbi:hypothetical protein [Paraburkholderia xenovorans]|nr:hypothetical protein [Paraburkholderia xenovorans]